jgi:hypothetical protein
MADPVDLRDAASTVQALREPLIGALQAAAGSLVRQGLPADRARAWAASELLAVVADALNAGLSRAPDGDPIDEAVPFDESDTLRHLQIERDMAVAAARLLAAGLEPSLAITAAATLCLESIAGILAGHARPISLGRDDSTATPR